MTSIFGSTTSPPKVTAHGHSGRPLSEPMITPHSPQTNNGYPSPRPSASPPYVRIFLHQGHSSGYCLHEACRQAGRLSGWPAGRLAGWRLALARLQDDWLAASRDLSGLQTGLAGSSALPMCCEPPPIFRFHSSTPELCATELGRLVWCWTKWSMTLTAQRVKGHNKPLHLLGCPEIDITPLRVFLESHVSGNTLNPKP